MTKDDIDRSIALAWEWSEQEIRAQTNAFNWLMQAQRGEVPSGNAYQPTKENPVEPTTDKPMGDA